MPFTAGGAELRAFRHTTYLRDSENIDATLVVWQRSTASHVDSTVPGFMIPIPIMVESPYSKQIVTAMLKLTLHLTEIYLRLGWFFLINRSRFDLVHVIGSGSWFNLIAVSIVKALRIPVITEMVGLGADDPLHLSKQSKSTKKQLFRHKPLKYRLFLRADAYVSKCHAISNAYQQAGLPLEKLNQIASAVNTDIFLPPRDAAEKAAIRNKLGLAVSGQILVFSGRICAQKGLHWLLPAMREVVEVLPDIKLLILGPVMSIDKGYAQARQQEVIAWGLSETVTFLGSVQNVNEYLKAADIFVLPTAYEGFSGSILEAMASGLPIITSDIPEIALSQIQQGVEGILLPVGEPEKLANTMIELFNSPDKRTQLGQAARRRVEQDFTFKIIGDHYLRLYEQVLVNKAA